jgi:hypothetical protein
MQRVSASEQQGGVVGAPFGKHGVQHRVAEALQ